MADNDQDEKFVCIEVNALHQDRGYRGHGGIKSALPCKTIIVCPPELVRLLRRS